MTLRSLHRNAALAVLLGASLATLTNAQASSSSGSATVQGIVRDSQHHPVAGAEVILESATSLRILKARADSTGAFKFSALPQGVYTIRAEAAGKGKAIPANLTLAESATRTVDLTLSDSTLAFFDEPTFSVAGVTDTTNLGGHGSDTVVRTKNALERATAELSKERAAGESANPTATEESLHAQLQRDPRSFEANVRLGKTLTESGRTDQAKSYLARASEIERLNNSISARDRADLHHLLGDVAEKSGDPLAAVREYQRAAELDASEPNMFDWGSELLLHHAPEPAAEVFGKGNRLFPHSVRMLVGLGVAAYVRGSYEQAAPKLCEAADLAPNDPAAYLFLGRIQSVESHVSAPIAQRLERFARLQPQNAMAHYYYALSLWKQRKGPDDRETASRVQSLLEKAVALDPQLGEAFLQLGIVHSERKDLSGAIAAFQQALQANPKLEQAHYRLAQAYRVIGESHKAQEELKLYQDISKEKTLEVERERTEVKQFVYTMRGRNPAQSQP